MYAIVFHKIQDWAKWKEVFDESAEERANAGLGQGWILRKADSPNEIYVVLNCRSREQAVELLCSTPLRTMMQRAGVIGEPVIMFYQEELEVRPPMPSHSRQPGQETY